MAQRVRNIASARLINAAECEEILEARSHLQEVRHRLILLGLTRDVVPENPDKLARLAHEFGYTDANDFLCIHERVVSRVRSIYEEGLERLKA
jgi:glutamine synthetase adenylyltransferase